MNQQEWYRANRENWDERVAIHRRSYQLSSLLSGQGRLAAIEEMDLHVEPGEKALHLQCHFGADTLILAQRGAEVVGLDFSAPAVGEARRLAEQLGLTGHARFVEANVYDALEALPEPASFDLVYVTWGAINWLPDVRRWAEIVAWFLKPGGRFYFAEGHPAAYVFDDARADSAGMPGWFVPYFEESPVVLDDDRDYSDPAARLTNTRTYEWMHPLGSVLSALLEVGLEIRQFREHDAVPWRMFKHLVEGPDGLFRWPEQRWLPLGYSLTAVKRAGGI